MPSSGADADPRVAVMFDFDGTLGDTETPAMEVAYWELAPYLPGKSAADLERERSAFIQQNAGRAFEQMIEHADGDRRRAGLPLAEEAYAAAAAVPEDCLRVVDAARRGFGLPPFLEARRRFGSLLQQQKEETNDALRVCARANPGVHETLAGLQAQAVPFSIATTSGKPRVPISVDAANLRRFFPPERIHSGESDFDPPRFKPDPAVYLKAVEEEGLDASHCIAVEDSASGVGSAANAKMGLIVGYVGGSHIPSEKKAAHAAMLMRGERSQDRRGADVVLGDFEDLLLVVDAFRGAVAERRAKPSFTLPFRGKVYLPA
eukprot:EG_transcript_14644